MTGELDASLALSVAFCYIFCLQEFHNTRAPLFVSNGPAGLLGQYLRPAIDMVFESPFELSESVGVDNFIVIILETLALFLKMHL